MNYNHYYKPKKTITMLNLTFFNIIFICLLVVTVPTLIFLHNPSASNCSSSSNSSFTYPIPTSSGVVGSGWSGDLRDAGFSWNHLQFGNDSTNSSPEKLKIAVFTRKWPVGSAPGGMERHAQTLHSSLAQRGHEIHVFTSSTNSSSVITPGINTPVIHFLSAPEGQWRPDEAWALFLEENSRNPFDAVHSESVALPHRHALDLSNLVVTWHGIEYEVLQSFMYEDLARSPDEPMSPLFARSFSERPLRLLNEIRFFQNYAHHIAISDSTGDVLRDVYQLPNRRVHVILNGVDSHQYLPDSSLGRQFRRDIGLPSNATLIMGVAGRLVRDKGHPLLHEAFSRLTTSHPTVHLVVAGSGPWAKRYANLGPQVSVLGAMPPEKLTAFYNSLDVFLNPTLRPQGLDLTLMEAMQCAKPVVATRFASIKGSVIVDEEFGHMFGPNVESLVEALEKVVEEGAVRLAERGKACRRYAAGMFSAEKMMAAYERLFLCVKNEVYCDYTMPKK